MFLSKLSLPLLPSASGSHLLQALVEAKKNGKKLDRGIFMYMDSKAPREKFAECQVCWQWCGDDICVIHGRNVKAPAAATCRWFVHGLPSFKPEQARVMVTPEVSGLTSRPTRCENCVAYLSETSDCNLFRQLNEELPDLFDLEERVDEYGCCNAQTPK